MLNVPWNLVTSKSLIVDIDNVDIEIEMMYDLMNFELVNCSHKSWSHINIL